MNRNSARLRNIRTCMLILGATATITVGQNTGNTADPSSTEQKILIAHAADGRTFQVIGTIESPGLSAPCLLRLPDGTLLGVFDRARPGDESAKPTLVISRSKDQGRTWSEPKPIELNWRGPAPAWCGHGEWLAAGDGLIRLYFVADAGRNASPVRAEGEKASGRFTVRSAATRDGNSFRLDDSVQIPTDAEAPPHLALFTVGRDTHLFISGGMPGEKPEHVASIQGKTFRPVSAQPAPILQRLRSIVPIEGGYRAFVTGDQAVISMFSPDGQSWAEEPGARLAGRCDPAVAQLADGSFLMLAAPVPPEKEPPLLAGAGGSSISPAALARAALFRDRTNSAKQLQRLGRACLLYAVDHNGDLPAELQTLLDSGALDAQSLSIPQALGGGTYVYVAGQRDTMNPQDILAYEPLIHDDQEGANALFLDGHVEWLKAEDLKQKLADSQERIGQK